MLRLADQESRTYELVDDPLDLLFSPRHEQPVQRTELSDLSERATQLGLEDDHERDEGDGEEGLQEEGRQSQLKRARDPVDEHEHEDADEQLDRLGSADEDQHVVDEHRHDDDVQDVVPAKGLAVEKTGEELVELPADLLHLVSRPEPGPRPPRQDHCGHPEATPARAVGTSPSRPRAYRACARPRRAAAGRRGRRRQPR